MVCALAWLAWLTWCARSPLPGFRDAAEFVRAWEPVLHQLAALLHPTGRSG